MTRDESLTVKSEFAHVTVSVDDRGNGPRLLITDQLGGRQRYVDPLELECLTRSATSMLDRYLPYQDGFLDLPA
jgi:hypothetical protein